MEEKEILREAEKKMDATVADTRHRLATVRTGRASLAVFDGVVVDYYGTPTPLNQVANLSVPDATLIVAQPFDPSTIGAIEKAIQASNLGVNPSNDGKLIRIPVPPLTEERRKDLVKQVKKGAEGHKIGVREARRTAVSMLKDLETESGLSTDDRRRAEKTIQDLTDENVKKIDEMTQQKEEEILQV